MVSVSSIVVEARNRGSRVRMSLRKILNCSSCFRTILKKSTPINLDHPKLSGETTIQGAVTEVAAMVGENVKFRRGFILSTSFHGVVSTYLHTCPQPGKENYILTEFTVKF
jgi:hypothetical protein